LVNEQEPPKFFFWLLDFLAIPYTNSAMEQAKFWRKFFKKMADA